VRFISRDYLPELLESPVRGGMDRDVEMGDSGRAHFHDHEHVQDATAGRHGDKEIAGENGLRMVANKRRQNAVWPRPTWRRGYRRGLPSSGIWRRTVRGETRIPSFTGSSAAMRSSPQVGFSLAILAISLRSSTGTRGRPRGFDFHFTAAESLADATGSKCPASRWSKLLATKTAWKALPGSSGWHH
jgi:hypothetical protein